MIITHFFYISSGLIIHYVDEAVYNETNILNENLVK